MDTFSLRYFSLYLLRVVGWLAMASRNIPGKPGNKGYTGGSAGKSPAVLVEDVKADYEKARRKVEWWEGRVKAKGATMTNRFGDRVRSPEQVSLENALTALARQTKLYRDIVGEDVVVEERRVPLDVDNQGEGPGGLRLVGERKSG